MKEYKNLLIKGDDSITEVSALNGTNIEECFIGLAKTVIEKRPDKLTLMKKN